MISDFRSLIESYENQGKISHVRKNVNSEYEVAGILRKTKGNIPICFDSIDNYKYPMVCSLGGSRKMLADSMNIAENELVSHLANAIVNPLETTYVENPPCQENVVTMPFNVADYFPVLKYYEKDATRFFISGIIAIKNLDGSKTYTSIRRMQYLGGNKFTILITSHEMKQQFRYCEENKKDIDIAVMFGVHPAVMLGSQINTHLYDSDKYKCTGALMGSSLRIAKAKTVDIDVIADAEVVLEGKVKPYQKVTEGPFGEMAGYYGIVSELPIVEFSAMTFRNNPIFQTVCAGGAEEKLSMGLIRELCLYNTIRQTVPLVQKVHITMGGQTRLHAVVQIKKVKATDGKQAALAAFASDKDLKHVVVVDDDVDIFDMEQVEWAIATRMQADRDIFIISGADGSPLEPSHVLGGTSAKMGMDATKPLGDSRFNKTYIPGEENINLKDYF